MEYKKVENKYILRLDPKEEILESIKELCIKNNIKAGSISGLGAVNEITVGLFNPETKIYQKETFKKDFEIVSLIGNISTMNNETYLHIHISVSDSDYKVIGGHLNSGLISATGEIIIESFNADLDRKFSEEIGLNLFEF